MLLLVSLDRDAGVRRSSYTIEVVADHGRAVRRVATALFEVGHLLVLAVCVRTSWLGQMKRKRTDKSQRELESVHWRNNDLRD